MHLNKILNDQLKLKEFFQRSLDMASSQISCDLSCDWSMLKEQTERNAMVRLGQLIPKGTDDDEIDQFMYDVTGLIFGLFEEHGAKLEDLAFTSDPDAIGELLERWLKGTALLWVGE